MLRTHCWVGESYVVHSQNEMLTQCCKLTLGWRKLSFAVPERDANPMAHTQSGLAQHDFPAFSERDANPMAHTRVWVGES